LSSPLKAIPSSLFTQPLTATNYFLCLWICLLWTFHITGIKQFVIFCDHFPSANTIFPRLIHVACINILLIYLFTYFGRTEVWTHGFTLAKQVLYNLSHTSIPHSFLWTNNIPLYRHTMLILFIHQLNILVVLTFLLLCARLLWMLMHEFLHGGWMLSFLWGFTPRSGIASQVVIFVLCFQEPPNHFLNSETVMLSHQQVMWVPLLHMSPHQHLY
jgi:hypothetical protein